MPSPHRTRQIATETAGGTAGVNVETLGGTKTLTTNDVVYHKLDPAGDRTVVLPTAAASFSGQTFVIHNASDATGEVITVNQSSTDSSTTRATIGKGETVTLLRSSASAWTSMAEQKGNRARHLSVGSAATYTLDAESSGCVVVANISARDVAVTLPAAEVGLHYTFMVTVTGSYDLEIISPSATNFFIGGFLLVDSTTTTAADQLQPIVSDNNSNDYCTMINPLAGTRLEMVCDGTNWNVGGFVYSAVATSAFADATGL
jgi:hypothetical protein